LADEPICPRCGCDLTLVRRAEAQARLLVGRAVQAWLHGDPDRARRLAHSALALDNTPLARSVLQGLRER
jgi:hypothetical protein